MPQISGAMADPADEPAYRELCDRVRRVLELRGISQRDWSLRAGQSHSYVSQLLQGRMAKGGPGLDAMRKLAEAARVEVCWLLTGQGPVEPGGGSVPAPRLGKAGPGPTGEALKAQAVALLRGHAHPNALAALEAEPAGPGRTLDELLARGAELHAKALEVEVQYKKTRAPS